MKLNSLNRPDVIMKQEIRVVKFLKYNIALVSVLIVLVLVHRITKLLWHHCVVQLVGDIIGHIHHGHGVVPRVGLDGGH